MKTKRQSHCGGRRSAISVLLALALAVGLALGMPAPGGVAYAAPILGTEGDEGGAAGSAAASGAGTLNLEQTCSVTVHFPTTMTGEDVTDLAEDKTVADLYLLAPAVRLSGYDVYAYCIDDGMPYYEAVKAYLAGTANWRTQQLTSAPDGYSPPAWTTQAQAAEPANYLLFRYAPADPDTASSAEQEGLVELLAKQLFAPESASGESAPQIPAQNTITPAGSGSIGQTIGNLPAGLYLNVVHGSELSGRTLTPNDYAVLVQSQDEKDENNNPLQKICTVACSDTKVYTFQPQLLSLPGLGLNEDGNPITDTTLGGTWAYAMDVTAKGEAANRFADLQLEKQLDALVEGGSAVFIFRVAAYAPDDAAFANPVYEKVITLRAESNNPDSLKSELITNRIPAGSTVVIIEEYTGAGYEFKNAKVDAAWNDAHQTAPKPEINNRVTIAGNRITITDIPAGRIHLTAPSGEENILQDGTAETVTVTNAPGTPVNGGSVINSFTQDANGGWQWTKRHYDAQTGAWVNDPAKPVTATQAGEG